MAVWIWSTYFCKINPKLVNCSDDGWTPLIVAAHKGRITVLTKLLDAGANIDATSVHGTALQKAVSHGHLEVVKYLLSRGASLNLQVGHLCTDLIAAVMTDNEEMVRLLLDKGADVNLLAEKWGTPLHHALSRSPKRNASIVELLLQRGAQDLEGDGYDLDSSPLKLLLDSGLLSY